MIRRSLGLLSSVRRGGGSPTPTPTPTAIDRAAWDGDSITADGFDGSGQPIGGATGYAAAYALANPSLTSKGFAISGSILGASGDARSPSSGSLWGRSDTVAAYLAGAARPVLTFLIGANDLPTGNAAGYRANILAYATYMKAHVANLVVGVGLILPKGSGAASYATANAERATINAGLRGDVGGGAIDFIFSVGEHPVYMQDGPACDPYFDGAGIHPQAAAKGGMRAQFAAAMDSLLALSVATTPSAFPFTAVNNAALSTPYTAYSLVTGLGLGTAATGSRNAPGTIARGLSSFGTSSLAYMNSDFVGARVTSSASYTDPVVGGATIGSRSQSFTVTTGANVSPVGYSTVAGEEVNVGFASTTVTFSARTIAVGRLFFQVYSSTTARQPASFKFTRSGTDYPATKLDGSNEDSWWYVDIPVAGSYVPSAVSAGSAFAWVAWLGIVATNCTSHSSGQRLAGGAYNNPVDFPSSQPVNANELGIVMIDAGASVTRNDGSTERSTLAVTDANRPSTMSIATLPATAKPSVNLSSGVSVPGGYAITAAP